MAQWLQAEHICCRPSTTHADRDFDRKVTRPSGRSPAKDELQMRAFWRRWNALMHGERGPTDCSDRPPVQRAAAE